MTFRRFARDNVDTGGENSGDRNRREDGRKAKQLCRQVEAALGYVLAGGDAVLETLQVVDVRPAPDSSRLLVFVLPDDAASFDRNLILARLNQHAGRLRTQIAASITRKRTPQLVFQVLSPA